MVPTRHSVAPVLLLRGAVRSRSITRNRQFAFGQDLDHRVAEAGRRDPALFQPDLQARGTDAVWVGGRAVTAPFEDHVAVIARERQLTVVSERDADGHGAGPALELERNAGGGHVGTDEARIR